MHTQLVFKYYISIIKVTDARVYLEITRFMQPMPILMPPSAKSFLGSKPLRPAHILYYELPAEVKPMDALAPPTLNVKF